MPTVDIVILVLLFILMILLLILIKNNNILLQKNQILEERLKLQNKYIANNRISLQNEKPKEKESEEKELSDTSLSEKVILSIEAGETKLSIVEKLDIPLSKIEFILKIDALKKSR
jgi:hypothetical protein